jgi:hypothetical protein
MSLIKWSIRERVRITAANTLTGELRGSAAQLLLYPLFGEPGDPLAADLDDRHARLSGLADDVPRRIRVAFYVDGVFSLLRKGPPMSSVVLSGWAITLSARAL